MEKTSEVRVISLKIQGYDDRKDLVEILANNGYKVWIEEVLVDANYSWLGTDYYVHFEQQMREDNDKKE